MGFWSTNLYGNDITCDVKNDIITNLAKGVDLNSILKDIEKNYDEQELILFILLLQILFGIMDYLLIK